MAHRPKPLVRAPHSGMMTPALARLNPRHRLLVLAYVQDPHAPIAALAKAAGYTSLTSTTAILAKPHVQAAITSCQAEVAKSVGISSKRLALEMSHLATSDLREAFTEWGTLLSPDEWPDKFAAAVQSIEFDGEGNLTKIRLWPKVQAATLLAQHLGMLQPERLEVSHTGSVRHEVVLSDRGKSLLSAVLDGIDTPMIDITPDATEPDPEPETGETT